MVKKANRYFVLCYSYYAYGDTSSGTLVKAIGPSDQEISCARRTWENIILYNFSHKVRDSCLNFAIEPFLWLTTPVWHIEIGFKCLGSTVLHLHAYLWTKIGVRVPLKYQILDIFQDILTHNFKNFGCKRKLIVSSYFIINYFKTCVRSYVSAVSS